MNSVLEALHLLADMGFGDYTIWEIIDKIENQ